MRYASGAIIGETMFHSDPEREARLVSAAESAVQAWLEAHGAAVAEGAVLQLAGMNDGIATLVIDGVPAPGVQSEYLEFKVSESGRVLNVHAYSETRSGVQSRPLSRAVTVRSASRDAAQSRGR